MKPSALLASTLVLAACGPIAGTETGNPNPRPVGMVTGSDVGAPAGGLPTGDVSTPGFGAGGAPEPVTSTGSGVSTGGGLGSVVQVPELGGATNGMQPVVGVAGMSPTGSVSEPGWSDMMPPGAVAGGPGSAPTAGGPGGAGQSCTDPDCEAFAEASIDGLSQPGLAPSEFTTATCQAGVCNCGSDGAVVVSLTPRDDCVLWGRARTCLVESTEYSACDVAQPASCDSACTLAHERLEADANATFSTDVVSAACDASNVCRFEVRIDGRCYADRSTVEVSCSDAASAQ